MSVFGSVVDVLIKWPVKVKYTHMDSCTCVCVCVKALEANFDCTC